MICKAPCSSHAPSCAPASRWRQGQALRVLRNLDTAGRGRSIDRAGSEGIPLSCPTKGIAFWECSSVARADAIAQ